MEQYDTLWPNSQNVAMQGPGVDFSPKGAAIAAPIHSPASGLLEDSVAANIVMGNGCVNPAHDIRSGRASTV